MESLALFREVEHARGEAAASGNLGLVLYDQGRFDEAQVHQEHQLQLCVELGDRRGEGHATGNLGMVSLALGRFEEARAQHDRQLALYRELGDRRGEAIASGNLGSVFAAEGRASRALEYHGRQLTLAREVGDRMQEATALYSIGDSWVTLGMAARATESLGAARRVANEIHYWMVESHVPWALGRIAAQLEDFEAAEREYAAAIRALRKLGAARDALAEVLVNLGSLLRRQGRDRDAAPHLEHALELAQGAGTPGPAVLARLYLAELSAGSMEAALEELSRSEARIAHHHRLEAHFLAWQATDDRTHLAKAHDLLVFLRDNAPDEPEARALDGDPLHRAVSESWHAQGACT